MDRCADEREREAVGCANLSVRVSGSVDATAYSFFLRDTLSLELKKVCLIMGNIWVNSQLCYISSALKGQKPEMG